MHLPCMRIRCALGETSSSSKIEAKPLSSKLKTSLGEPQFIGRYPGVIVTLLLLLVTYIQPGFSRSQDSLAYTFRQDNLSTNNDIKLSYNHSFAGSELNITDVLLYNVFSFDNIVSDKKQYSVEHRLKSDFSWGKRRGKSIRLESSQHQDHRTGLATSINNWALLAGFKKDNAYSLFLGGRSVERYGIIDEGVAAELDFHQSWKSRSQQSSLHFTGTRDELKQHLNHTINARADYRIHFGNISTFQTSLFREIRLQAFHTDSLGSSQSRNNDNLLWQNQFVYHLKPNLHVSHRLNWGDQLTEIRQEKVGENFTLNLISEDRKRFALLNETALQLKNPNFSSLTAFKVENSQNKYYVDYTQVLYQLREEVHWQNNLFLDSLSWISTLSRLEYDTPDTTNDDDRDEWRVNTEFRMVWQPTPFYQIDVGAKLGLFHLIYLFNTRSSENHWNRNLVLWSGFSWKKDSWRGEGRARIRSNYFDYDYDELFIELDQPTRSFVHRSLDMQKQLAYKMGNRWSLVSKAVFRWEDEGKFRWESFIQQISSQREQSEMSLKLNYAYHGWEGWIGFLTHKRIIKYSIANRESEHWEGQGPLMGVNYSLGNRLALKGDARFISVKDQDREYLLPKVFLTLVYR